MFSRIKDIFKIIEKVFSIYTLIISLAELESDGELEGSEKEQKAIEWLNEAVEELIEREVIPEWVENIFFNEYMEKWIISVLVNIAHRIGIFSKDEKKNG